MPTGWMLRYGKKSGGLLGLLMLFGVAQWALGSVRGLAQSLSRSTGKLHRAVILELIADCGHYRDRPWQAFPITILVGAYIGYAVGSLVARTPLLYGKRIQFTPEEDENEKKTN